jgi:hypothetical protein
VRFLIGSFQTNDAPTEIAAATRRFRKIKDDGRVKYSRIPEAPIREIAGSFRYRNGLMIRMLRERALHRLLVSVAIYLDLSWIYLIILFAEHTERACRKSYYKRKSGVLHRSALNK